MLGKTEKSQDTGFRKTLETVNADLFYQFAICYKIFGIWQVHIGLPYAAIKNVETFVQWFFDLTVTVIVWQEIMLFLIFFEANPRPSLALFSTRDVKTLTVESTPLALNV